MAKISHIFNPLDIIVDIPQQDDIYSALSSACDEMQIEFKEVPTDGTWHTVNAIDDAIHNKKNSGRILLFADGNGGIVCNWRIGEIKKFFVKNFNISQLNSQELANIKQAQSQAEAERKQKAQQALESANLVIDQAEPAQADHPYLVKKSVEPTVTLLELDSSQLKPILGYIPKSNGTQLTGRILIAPVVTDAGLTSLEFIDESGNKSALFGANKTGGFWQTNPPADDANIVVICEGVATALSIYQATNFYTVAALSCHNLKNVAENLIQYYSQVIIAGDLGNGSNKAIQAAQAIKGRCAFPEFTDETKANWIELYNGKLPTDFNDLHQATGLSSVYEQITKQIITVAAANAANLAITPHVVDQKTQYVQLDLLQYISHECLLSKLVQELHDATLIPESTILMLGLGVFSLGMARRYVVDYKYNGYLPIGLYICSEHPSGTSKSRVINMFTWPFKEAIHQARQQYNANLQQLKKQIKDTKDKEVKFALKDQLGKLQQLGFPSMFLTNATPEAIENTLYGTGGFFALASSEQGLFDSVFGLSYAKNNTVTNKDIMLHGYDSGYHSSSRITRIGYTGHVIGGIVLFAQDGSIQKLIKVGSGIGLAERFLLLVEPHSLGFRDHNDEAYISKEIKDAYSELCQNIMQQVQYPIVTDSLIHLTISPIGWGKIQAFRNKIEPELANGKRYSHGMIRGQAAKIDMTVMKIAANLHLFDGGWQWQEIDDSEIDSAIAIARDLLESALTIMDVKEIDGPSSAMQTILNLFAKRGKPLTEREIIQNVKGSNPFKSFTGSQTQFVKETLQTLLNNGMLSYTQEGNKKTYKLDQ